MYIVFVVVRKVDITIFELYAVHYRAEFAVSGDRFFGAASFTYLSSPRLVVAHGINGQRMEKFYLIGSAAMSAILTVPPYAAGQYG